MSSGMQIDHYWLRRQQAQAFRLGHNLDYARSGRQYGSQQQRRALMPKHKSKPDPYYAQQAAVVAILKILCRPRGATVAEIVKARGLQPHTVRSILSRLDSKMAPFANLIG
jgi:hypothetical protein